MRRSSTGAAEPSQLAFELVHEQIRHNLALVRVIGWATDWDGIIQVQEDFLRTSFERMHLLAVCWLDLFLVSRPA